MSVRHRHCAAGPLALSLSAPSSLLLAATAGADAADGRWHFKLVP
jgi:hypothetical protein